MCYIFVYVAGLTTVMDRPEKTAKKQQLKVNDGSSSHLCQSSEACHLAELGRRSCQLGRSSNVHMLSICSTEKAPCVPAADPCDAKCLATPVLSKGN
jgi:hypothetical protein